MLEAELQIEPEENMKVYVSSRLREIRLEQDLTYNSLGDLHEVMGISFMSAKKFASDICNGDWGSTNKLKPHLRSGRKTAHLLSILFKALDIDKDDKMIKLIKEHYGDVFQYPPDCDIPELYHGWRKKYGRCDECEYRKSSEHTCEEWLY